MGGRHCAAGPPMSRRGGLSTRCMDDDVCINLSDRLSASFLIAVSSALDRKYIS